MSTGPKYKQGLPPHAHELLAGNASNAAVAEQLGVSRQAVYYHRRRLKVGAIRVLPNRSHRQAEVNRGRAEERRRLNPKAYEDETQAQHDTACEAVELPALERDAACLARMEQAEALGLTTRQMDVFSMEPTPSLLGELVRERPKGTCCVCWRDIREYSALVAPRLVCGRFKPGTRSDACRIFAERLQRMAGRAQEQAKQSLLLEGAQR